MAGMFRAWLGMFKISNSNCTRNRDSHFISLFLSINTTHCLHPSLSVVHTLFLHISFYQCLYLCHSLTPSVFLLITLSLHLSTSVTLSSSDFLLVSHYLQSVLLAVTVSVCLSVCHPFFLSFNFRLSSSLWNSFKLFRPALSSQHRSLSLRTLPH